MSTKYKFHDPDGCYFVTFAVVGWVDLFTRNVYKEILLESWRYCQQQKGLLIHAYVIMTNHVHMIISKNSDKLLEEIMRDMKKFTSSKLLEAIKKEPESRREWMLALFRQAGESNSNNKIFQLWQQDNHPIECGSPTILSQKMDYVHENPVRAGFVEKAEDWTYSSAAHYYCGKKSLIELSYV
jgi:putative transposase